MPRTDERGFPMPEEQPASYAGLSGVNLPIIPFHGTGREQLELIYAVRRHLGDCECVIHSDPFGNQCQGHPCAGHLFLCEVDEGGRTMEWTVPEPFGATHFTTGALRHRVTRLDRLMFARSQRGRWEAGEWGTIIRIDKDSPFSSLISQVSAIITPVTPGESTNPEDFPW